MDLYKILSECRLCPMECGVDRLSGETGFCGAGAKARIARADLHFWEEPCISGENGSGAVFFSNCTLRCVYCQNYDVSSKGKGLEKMDEELADCFLELQDKGANNINLVTPTHYIPQLVSALDNAKKRGLNLPVVYNCGGYEKAETLKLIDGYVDVYLPDMKYYSDKYAKRYSGAKDYFKTASEAVSEMYRQVGKWEFDNSGLIKKGVIVRHMLLPGLIFEAKKIVDYLFEKYEDKIWLSLMSQYTIMPGVRGMDELNRNLPKGYYETLVDYCASLGMENVYVQEEGSSDLCYIPEFYGSYQSLSEEGE